MSKDFVHPWRYLHPTGIECIDVIERVPFCVGAAIKHLWAAGSKADRGPDIHKAAFYLDRILQDGSESLWCANPHDHILSRYAERLAEHGGWNAHVIWHILQGVQSHSKAHIGAARNQLYHFINNPQEKRDGPRPQLPS